MGVEQDNSSTFDWSGLPEGTEVASLWECLHDGLLLKVVTDTAESIARLEFDVGHMRKFHGLADASRFMLNFSGVKSLGVKRPYPAGFVTVDGEGMEERNRRIREYHEKWHREGISWSAWETALAQADHRFDVYEAEFAMGPDFVSVQIGLEDGNWTIATVSAATLQISISDGTQLSLEAFLKMGNDYWEAFAARGL